jgi:sugar/nucleoside kinase (ribokinase family)
MNNRRGVLAGGNWIVDHVKLLDAWPQQDALANITGQSWGNGGSAYNILKDLALLGAQFPLEAVGLVGDDADGRAIMQDCAAHRIEASQLRVTRDAATSYTDVMTVRGSGRRTFFHQRGANALLGPAHFDFSRTRAKICHVGYLLLLDGLDALGADGETGAKKVLRAARAAGLRTSADCVSDQSGRFVATVTPSLPHIDYFFANDYEAARLTGVTLDGNAARDPATMGAAAKKLRASGVGAWAFVHSVHGVVAASADQQLWQPAVLVPPGDIKGAAGAGDALAAGILFGLHEDWPVAECLRLGVCAAAASLYDATCSGSVRPADECRRLGEKFGFR